MRLTPESLMAWGFFIIIFFWGEPLRALRALASGYALHHPRHRFAVSRVVPLLSLSQHANEE
jgi:hypothetical protein